MSTHPYILSVEMEYPTVHHEYMSRCFCLLHHCTLRWLIDPTSTCALYKEAASYVSFTHPPGAWADSTRRIQSVRMRGRFLRIYSSVDEHKTNFNIEVYAFAAQMPSDRGIAVLGTSDDILKSVAEELSNLRSTHGVYCIDNKYYSASVPIRFDSDVEVLVEEVFQGDKGVEALVVVIDASSKDFLFDRFAPWWEDVMNVYQDTSVEISLVFCRDMNMGQEEHAPFLVQAQDWCVDQGFELIEGQRYDEKGIADCETGMVRLEDALQAHMWPGAVMKTRAHGDENPAASIDMGDEDDRLVMEAIFGRLGVCLHKNIICAYQIGNAVE